MTLPVVSEASPRSLALSDDELIPTMRSAIYPGASDASIKLALSWCRAQGKDPLKRPVHLVPMRVKKVGGGPNDYEFRDVVMPGIVDYRTDAARTGTHAGNDEAVFGPDVTTKLAGVDITYPDWCEFTVYRIVGGQRCKFTSGKIRWLETYATAKYDTLAPNAMWRKRPYGQLEKCAEAMALRRAFPEVGAQPTAEEMIGRESFDMIDGVEVSGDASQAGAAAAAGAPAFNVQRKAKPATEAGEGGAAAVTDVEPKKAASAPAKADPPAPPAPPPPSGDDLIGTGELNYLRNKAKALDVDLEKVAAELGGLVIEKLSKSDFTIIKAHLRQIEG
jgi:phage recombination protein Bet